MTFKKKKKKKVIEKLLVFHCSDCPAIINLEYKVFIDSKKMSVYFGLVLIAMSGGGISQLEKL